MLVPGYVDGYTDSALVIRGSYNKNELKKRIDKQGRRVLVRLVDSRQLSHDQRKKIYATINDIANYSGEYNLFGKDATKNLLKSQFVEMTEEEKGYGWFSLATCSMELARDFITYLIEFCFENDIPTLVPLIERFDDIERYLHLCCKYKKCAICNDHGEIHHIDVIGMGSNRRKKDDRDHRKICLCRLHHDDAHTIGWPEFAELHHVKGIIYNE